MPVAVPFPAIHGPTEGFSGEVLDGIRMCLARLASATFRTRLHRPGLASGHFLVIPALPAGLRPVAALSQPARFSPAALRNARHAIVSAWTTSKR